MKTLVYGGSGSGKSAYAESLAIESVCGKRFYVATMKVFDAEGERKVMRHRKLREGKNFILVEQTENIGEVSDKLGGYCNGRKSSGNFALLECMSNLVANEMFGGNRQVPSADEVVQKVCHDMEGFLAAFDDVVVVSNNIFEDGIEYDESVREYMKALGIVNRWLSKNFDRVVEVVAGIPVEVKNENLIGRKS